MPENILFIKNMVCPRCVSTIREILTSLEIPFQKIDLGEVLLKQSVTEKQEKQLQAEFKKVGFEIISQKHDRIVNAIKAIVIKGVYENKDFKDRNLSDILSEALNFEYSHLSSIFSKQEGKSIQKFQHSIKMERAKELLKYDELSISEIALELGSNSAAYLSTQFKQSLGMSPSQYRLQQLNARKHLDSI
ncbi:AraC family transcriptional regulator [Gillisia sp. M10.2A]|uniref:AraC family transcriptional regulator n=1 Tax=Gillisia lutea TaxID=2909668 RepID=A0ABS9EDD4_9FLAO|nr:AraC family transcriptional regulator [Gillisia lutea]MCF4100885.1 AraC family transcriptional regulator [Gillisia lutea]